MASEVFIAEFRYNSANLSAHAIEKETDKMIFLHIDGKRPIIGRAYHGRTIRKDHPILHRNLQDALVYLVRCAEDNLIRRTEVVRDAEEQLAMLDRRLKDVG